MSFKSTLEVPASGYGAFLSQLWWEYIFAISLFYLHM